MGKALDALKIPFYPAHPSNYTVGRGRPIKYITIHHIAGTPSTLRHLWQDPARNGSSTFAVFPGYLEQYVKISDTPWTNGNFASNQESITIEVYGDWRNGRTYPVLDELKRLIRAIRLDIASLGQTYHQDVSLQFTECPAQLRAHAKRIFDELTAEFNTPAPTPTPTPPANKITYEAITPKKIITKWEANLWNFNFTSWPQAKPVKGYPKGFVIEAVGVATNQLGGKYYFTQYSAVGNEQLTPEQLRNRINSASFKPFATNGFNRADVEDFKEAPAPAPEPTPTPTPTPPKLIAGLKFTRYEQPIKVATLTDGVQLWDFNYDKWGDIAAHPVDKFAKGHEITIVGDVQHPLGGIYVMTDYSFGKGDPKQPDFAPHKTWGINVVDVKELEVAPAPVPEPTPEPAPPVDEDPDFDIPDVGPGDLLTPKPGETAHTWLLRIWPKVLRWLKDILGKFNFGGK